MQLYIVKWYDQLFPVQGKRSQWGSVIHCLVVILSLVFSLPLKANHKKIICLCGIDLCQAQSDASHLRLWNKRSLYNSEVITSAMVEAMTLWSKIPCGNCCSERTSSRVWSSESACCDRTGCSDTAQVLSMNCELTVQFGLVAKVNRVGRRR